MIEDDCKIGRKLEEIHKWTHLCLGGLSCQDLHRAHEIGDQILSLLNGIDATNGVKFIALFEALQVGTEVLEQDVRLMVGSKTIQ